MSVVDCNRCCGCCRHLYSAPPFLYIYLYHSVALSLYCPFTLPLDFNLAFHHPQIEYKRCIPIFCNFRSVRMPKVLRTLLFAQFFLSVCARFFAFVPCLFVLGILSHPSSNDSHSHSLNVSFLLSNKCVGVSERVFLFYMKNLSYISTHCPTLRLKLLSTLKLCSNIFRLCFGFACILFFSTAHMHRSRSLVFRSHHFLSTSICVFDAFDAATPQLKKTVASFIVNSSGSN